MNIRKKKNGSKKLHKSQSISPSVVSNIQRLADSVIGRSTEMLKKWHDAEAVGLLVGEGTIIKL